MNYSHAIDLQENFPHGKISQKIPATPLPPEIIVMC